MERQAEAEKKIASSVGEVVSEYQRMKAEWEQLSSAQAKKEWLDKNRDAFEQLGLNINNAVDADEAFVRSSDKVIEALKARAKAEALQDLYKQKVQDAYERAVAEGSNNTVVDTKSAVNAQVRAAAGVTRDDEEYSTYSDQFGTHESYKGLTEAGAAKVNEYYRKKAEEDVARLTQEYTEEVDNVYGKMFTTAQQEAASAAAATGGLVGDKPSGTVTGGTTGGGGGEVDVKERLKQLEESKKKEMAINQIAYLHGKKDYQTYTTGQIQAEMKFQKSKMELYKEGSTEYLEAQAAYLQASKNLQKEITGQTVKDEQQRYSDEKVVLQQHYADGELSAKAYQLAMEQSELQHLQNMVILYEEGSEEHIKAQEKYNQRSLAIQQKHAEEAKKIQERLQKEYFSNVGMTSNTESYEEEKLQLEAVRQIMMAQATAEQKLEIEEAYQKAKYELAKKYNDEAGMMAVDAAQASVDKVLEYMKTDAFQSFYQSFQTLVDGMGRIFSNLTSLIDAETALQEQEITKKYDAELAAAEGNASATERIEAEKEKEIAAMKNEA